MVSDYSVLKHWNLISKQLSTQHIIQKAIQHNKSNHDLIMAQKALDLKM